MQCFICIPARQAIGTFRSIGRSFAGGKDMCELRVMELIGDLASLPAAAFFKADKQWEGAKTHWLSQEKR
ncbi:MAG: hypothetical protein CL800_08055 [Citromicrobium sp.]|nr:hypothetical protein [Citromicrobium sp.]HAD18248.1 hypothetical protein [Erythrobacter sp.]